jgi:hypothetical protein
VPRLHAERTLAQRRDQQHVEITARFDLACQNREGPWRSPGAVCRGPLRRPFSALKTPQIGHAIHGC